MLAYLFILVAAFLRIVPHPWHFTPVAASLLYFGAKQPPRRMWIPFVLFAATDFYLTKFVYSMSFSLAGYLLTFVWYLSAIGIGSLLKHNPGVVKIAGAALGASVSFFVLSNFSVWLFGSMYAKNLDGLITCYIKAIPFFRNTLSSDMVFSFAAFGIPRLAQALSRHLGEDTEDISAA